MLIRVDTFAPNLMLMFCIGCEPVPHHLSLSRWEGDWQATMAHDSIGGRAVVMAIELHFTESATGVKLASRDVADSNQIHS